MDCFGIPNVDMDFTRLVAVYVHQTALMVWLISVFLVQKNLTVEELAHHLDAQLINSMMQAYAILTANRISPGRDQFAGKIVVQMKMNVELCVYLVKIHAANK